MKNLILILFLVPSVLINAQTIDFENFNEMIMNQALFSKMNQYSFLHGWDSLTLSEVDRDKIYACLKKKSDRLSLDDLGYIIARKILKSYSNPSFLCVGLMDSLSYINNNSYQELADQCVSHWEKNPSDAFFLLSWGTEIVVTSFDNKKNKTVYISLVYLH